MDSKGRLSPSEPVRNTTEIQSVSHGAIKGFHLLEKCWRHMIVIEENGVRLRLNIVDTPGYGDQVNNDRWYGGTLQTGTEESNSL